jgi:hypothetical protein
MKAYSSIGGFLANPFFAGAAKVFRTHARARPAGRVARAGVDPNLNLFAAGNQAVPFARRDERGQRQFHEDAGFQVV